jgi:hypothetical protein
MQAHRQACIARVGVSAAGRICVWLEAMVKFRRTSHPVSIDTGQRHPNLTATEREVMTELPGDVAKWPI